MAATFSWPRSANASRNVTKPTTARSIPIADDALSTPALRSSARSRSSAGSAAIVVAGTRSPATVAAANTAPASATTAPGPTSRIRMAPGSPAANPASPDSSCSFELASTSPASLSTTVGTIAAFATW